MEKLTLKEFVAAVMSLPQNKPFPYPESDKKFFSIVGSNSPEGPILIRRWEIKKGEKKGGQEIVPMSSNMILRYLNALNSGMPVHVDRVLGASYNTRSVLEAVTSLLPYCFMCRPPRVTRLEDNTLQYDYNGHKHLIYKPEAKPHAAGVTTWDKTVQGFISELPSADCYFDVVPADYGTEKRKRTPEDELTCRIHSLMQVILSMLAQWLDIRSWVAVQDKGIQYKGKPIMDMPCMVHDLHNERLLSHAEAAINVAKNIDCLWFNGGLPYVFEVEHSTGVTSGLTRMKKFDDAMQGGLKTDYVIVAPDEDRSQVIAKASAEQFSRMPLWYMPYSGMYDLLDMIQKRKAYDINIRSFLKMYMEPLSKTAETSLSTMEAHKAS